MWRLHRPHPSLSTLPSFSLRHFSSSSAAVTLPAPSPDSAVTLPAPSPDSADPPPPPPPPPAPSPPPLEDRFEGFPRPDPKYSETILAIPRETSGKTVAAKERLAGRVPSIVFEQEKGEEGGNKRLISVRSNQIWKLVRHMGSSFFLSRLFDLEVRPQFDHADGVEPEVIEKVRVLPRLLHLHPTTDKILNVTFLRAPSSALLKVDVPIVFRGEDVCPGLRKGGYLQVLRRTAKYLCPSDIIPPYIDVDISELDVEKKLFLRDLKVHSALKLLVSPDEPICKIKGSRSSEHRKPK